MSLFQRWTASASVLVMQTRSTCLPEMNTALLMAASPFLRFRPLSWREAVREDRSRKAGIPESRRRTNPNVREGTGSHWSGRRHDTELMGMAVRSGAVRRYLRSGYAPRTHYKRYPKPPCPSTIPCQGGDGVQDRIFACCHSGPVSEWCYGGETSAPVARKSVLRLRMARETPEKKRPTGSLFSSPSLSHAHARIRLRRATT